MKYQDIQINDVSLQSQFAALWMNGNYTGALDLLRNSGQLDTKSFMAKVMLKIGASLSIIEEYYYNDFEAALHLDLTAFNESIFQFRTRSNWDSTINYKVGNVVVYNGQSYMCIEDNINQLPTNTTYWVLLGLVGDVGVSGTGVNLRYQWSASVRYTANDGVVYGNSIWVATQNNIGQTPAQGSQYWEEFLNFPKINIMVSDTAPTTLYDGLIWIKILGN